MSPLATALAHSPALVRRLGEIARKTDKAAQARLDLGAALFRLGRKEHADQVAALTPSQAAALLEELGHPVGRKPGRPPLPDARKQRLRVILTAAEFAAVKRAAGKSPVAAWCRDVVLAAAGLSKG